MDGSRDAIPRKIWVHQTFSEEVAVKEHGYLCPWNDYPRGAHKRLLPLLSPNVSLLQVITGRKPFEHIRLDAALIPKILYGTRPDRPIVGFSDKLWALLDQMWLEEFESTDSPSVRPNTTSILESLQDEAEIWCPMGEKLAAPSEQIKRRVSSMSSAFVGGACLWLI